MYRNKQTVVFISGFLTPTDWLSYPVDLIPENINLISVYPSPTGSLHDRACQVFYELYGGTVDYGKEHSDFHNHERFGRKFEKGKLSMWDEDNPITIIGHSLGGCTAWVLQNYLAQGRFAGIPTSAAWVSNVICVSAPLNGALQVHTRGKDICHPPLVRWGSSGCMVGWCAQWVEYFDLSIFKSYMDFQQGKTKSFIFACAKLTMPISNFLPQLTARCRGETSDLSESFFCPCSGTAFIPIQTT